MTCDRTRESTSRCDSIESTSGAISYANNTTYTRWIDVDGMVDSDADGADDTFNSSSADLFVPAAARIAWAGIYWHGNEQNDGSRTAIATGPREEIELRLAGSSSYITVTAEWCNTIGDRYACFADVADLLPSAATGTYTVGNIFAHAGQGDYVGGWEMLVAYEDPGLPMRSLSVFDGYQQYGGGSSQTFLINEFLTPPAGSIKAEIGVTIGEGDASASDNLEFQSELAPTRSAIATDLGNGSIESFGANVTSRTPAFRNTLGHDSDLFDVGTLVRNGAREATIILPGSGGETNELIKVDFAVDVYFPEIRTQKSVEDLDGGDVVVGDTLRYTLRVENEASATDTAVAIVLTDELSPLLEFVPGSIAVVTTPTNGPVPGARTDLPGDDIATWDAATRTITVNVGRNADATSGGELAPGEFMEISFDATLLPASKDQVVANTAFVSFQGATLAADGRIRVATTDSDDPSTPDRDSTDVSPTDDPDGDGLGASDNDEDNDGIPDATEGFGVDVSGDDDGDGVPDWADPDSAGFVDINGDITDDRYDTDGDSIPNHLDLDSDGDGLFDIEETSGAALDADFDGRIDAVIDLDEDGILDVVDQDQAGTPLTIPNTDGVGLADPYDADDDGDGILTSVEVVDSAIFGDDLDGDGIPPWRDTESDGDGIADEDETADIDVDGIPDYLDADQTFITSPTDGRRFQVGTVAVVGETEGGASVVVQLRSDTGAVVDSVTVSADAAGLFTHTFAAIGDGLYTVAAVATDAGGKSATDTVDIIVAAVFVTIDSPTDGEIVSDATPALEGRADPGVAVTLVFDEGTPDEQTITTNATASGDWFAFAPSLADGSHQVVARVDDGMGNTAQDEVQFNVDASPPGVTVDAPLDGSETPDNTPLIAGTTLPGEDVDVSIDGTRVATVTADASGNWSYQTTIALADGIHTALARVFDSAGNPGEASSQFDVDTRAPVIAISTPGDGATIGSTQPTISGTTEAGAEVVLTLDGAVVATIIADVDGTWSYTPTVPLADGMHLVTAVARDGSGNASSPASNSFSVDTSIPFVQITAPASGTTISDATPVVTGRAEPNGLVAIEVDGLAAGSAAANANGDWQFTLSTPLAEGSHIVTATITTNVASATDTTTFAVDTTGPVLAVDTPLDGDVVLDAPTIEGSSEPGATVAVTLPDGTVVTTIADATGAWSVTTSSIPEGPARLLVTASDEAGNQTERTIDVIVDVTNPLMDITNPDDNTTKNDPLLTFEGTTDEPNSEVVLVLDGVEVTRITSDAFGDWEYTPTTPLADGVHTLRAFVDDAAGNRGEDTVDFIIDTRAPDLSIASPTEGEEVTTARPVIVGKADPGLEVVVLIDGVVAATVTADAGGDWSYTPGSDLSDGEHAVRAESTDAAGNSASDEVGFVVDTVAPYVTIIVPADGSTVSNTTVSVVGQAKPGETLEIFLDGTKLGETLAAADGMWTFVVIGLTEGSHTLSAIIVGANDSVTFVVDTTAPAVTLVSPVDGALIADDTPLISGTSEPGGVVEVFIDGQKVGEVTTDANGDWSYTPDSLDDGNHTVEARATDEADNEGTSGTITFTVDTTAPEVSIETPSEGEEVDADVVVSGRSEPGARVEVFVDGVKVGEATADAEGEWSVTTSNPGAGEHEVDVIASDVAGNTNEVGPITFSVPDGGANSGTNNGTNNGSNNGTNNGTGPNATDEDDYSRSYLQGGCAQSGGAIPLGPAGLLLLGAFIARRRRRTTC